jgi:hypothetical protein
MAESGEHQQRETKRGKSGSSDHHRWEGGLQRFSSTSAIPFYNPAFGTNAGFSWLRVWLRLGSGFGDDQRYVTVTDDHSGRKEMLHDFNRIVLHGLTRSYSVVTA